MYFVVCLGEFFYGKNCKTVTIQNGNDEVCVSYLEKIGSSSSYKLYRELIHCLSRVLSV